MTMKINEETNMAIWPAFTDVAISMLLIFLFFVFLQFVSNSKVFLLMQMEERQEHLARQFEMEFPQQIELKQISITPDASLQKFTFGDQILFDSGLANLKPEGREILERVGELFEKNSVYIQQGKKPRKSYDKIQVDGYTDDSPINNANFSSNWELASARALAVIKLFQQMGIDPKRLSATSFGEFQPAAANNTESGQAQNRRIEITLVYSRDLDGGLK